MAIEVFDSTMLGDSLQCLRLFYWRHERHLVPVAPSLPLAYGKAVHASLAAHYRGASLVEAVQAFEDAWQQEVGDLDEESLADPKRNPLRWAETLSAYRDFYRTEPFKVASVEAKAMVELTSDLCLAGVIDLTVVMNGRLTIVDHKTTTIVNPQFFQAFGMRHQFTAYILMAQRLLGLPEPPELIVNCILVTDRPVPPGRRFFRYPTSRAQWQLDAWVDEVVGWWQVVRQCRRSGNWPRNDDRCFRWRPSCPYYVLCGSTDADFTKVDPPAALFRLEQWNPT